MTDQTSTTVPVPQVPAITRPFGVLAALLVLWFAILGLFALWPALDIDAAATFFAAGACEAGKPAGTICGIFPLSESRAMVVLRYALYYLPHLFGVILLGMIIVERRRTVPRFQPGFVRKAVIYLAALIGGPVILVNGILKQVSNRPRPYQTDLFGGTFDFTSAGDFTGACLKNCSFISGEASGMGWVVCLALLVPAPQRRLVLPVLLIVTLLGAALRVGFGGHYLSDAILGYLSSLVMLALMAVIIGWPGKVAN